MTERLLLTAVLEPLDNGHWQAGVAGFPSVITSAPTREEARELVVDALREHLVVLSAQDVPRRKILERFEVVLDP